MRNIERLTNYIKKTGNENSILIHTLPGTSCWLICQKIEENKWTITMGEPMGNVFFNVGTVNDAQHLLLWGELIRLEIEKHTKQIVIAQQYRQEIKNETKISEESGGVKNCTHCGVNQMKDARFCSSCGKPFTQD